MEEAASNDGRKVGGSQIWEFEGSGYMCMDG